MRAPGDPAEIVLLRHAATALNGADRYQSDSDAGLTPDAGRGIRETASALHRDGWSGVWCSPARRAVETAAPLAAALGFAAREVPDLAERGLGDLDGRDRAAHRRTDPDAARRLVSDLDHVPPGGESLRAALARLCRGLARVVADGRPGRALVVTHGGLLNALGLALTGEPLAVRPAHAACLVLHGEGPAAAVPLADVPLPDCAGHWPRAGTGDLPWPITPAVI